MDGDLRFLGLLNLFGDRYPQNAVVMLRYNVVTIRGFGQAEGPSARAIAPFDDVVLLVLFIPLLLPFSGYAKHAILEVDIDVLLIVSWQIRLN